MGSEAITVDARYWPVVHVVYQRPKLTLADLGSFHERLDQLLVRGERFVTVIDTTRVRRIPGPLVLRKNEAWVERNQEVLAQLSLGTVTITKNALARSVAQWVLHQRKVRTGGAVVASVEDAVRWAMDRLRARGVPFDEALVSRLLVDHEAEDNLGLLHVDAEVEEDKQALVELVMSAFSEPAFLVDRSGELLFRNAAADELFDAPPVWVHRALDDGHSALKALCRVVPLAVGADLFVVVPSADLIPSRDQPAAALELPESLMRVADPLARGLSDREIADFTGLSHATVRTYVRRIFQKTGVHSRGAFIRLYASEPGRLQM
jgi:hypothetical protein